MFSGAIETQPLPIEVDLVALFGDVADVIGEGTLGDFDFGSGTATPAESENDDHPPDDSEEKKEEKWGHFGVY